jgi:hypothetical protein
LPSDFKFSPVTGEHAKKVGERDGRVAIIMDDAGMSVDHFCQLSPSIVTAGNILKIALGAAKGLKTMHENNLGHDDFSARNLMVSLRDGTVVDKVKLVDFGYARHKDAPSAHQAHLDVTVEEGDVHWRFPMFLSLLLKEATADTPDSERRLLCPAPSSESAEDAELRKRLRQLLDRMREDCGNCCGNCWSTDDLFRDEEAAERAREEFAAMLANRGQLAGTDWSMEKIISELEGLAPSYSQRSALTRDDGIIDQRLSSTQLLQNSRKRRRLAELRFGLKLMQVQSLREETIREVEEEIRLLEEAIQKNGGAIDDGELDAAVGNEILNDPRTGIYQEGTEREKQEMRKYVNAVPRETRPFLARLFESCFGASGCTRSSRLGNRAIRAGSGTHLVIELN